MAKIQTNPKNWKFIGGSLSLDLVNTVGGRLESGAVLNDKLEGYNDLLEWSRLAHITSQAESRDLAQVAAAHRKGAESTFARAVLLREALYRIFKAVAEDRRPRVADLETLSQELKIARDRQRFAHKNGAFGWIWDDGDIALDRVLWPVALSAADVLTSSDLSRLRQCEGTDCGWLFLDTSRNNSRQWCDMKDCGNRAKVRRFRTRQQRGHRQMRIAK